MDQPFTCSRRTKARADRKVSADQRGHSLGVSLGVYAISDLTRKAGAVKKPEANATSDSGLEFVKEKTE